MAEPTILFQPPETFNIADYFLDARVREGRGDRIALRTTEGAWTYGEVQALANRFGSLLLEAGVQAEQRVIIALQDRPEYVAALFGTLKIGAAVVMVNPFLREDGIAHFYDYTRARVAIVEHEGGDAFGRAAAHARFPPELIVVGDPEFDSRLAAQPATLEPFPTHCDDAAIWLFSGGTSGRPKAVVQTHTSYANTTECYGKRVLGLTEEDITISVPKLYFGYAMGSNLFFPFSVGASCVLFPQRCTAEALFERIGRFRPTVLVNVPTMVEQMVSHASAPAQDLSSLRIATSAGEALPVALHRRWQETFDVALLDGLGTAEMWHIFVSNRPDDVRPGTLGRAVPGFDVRLRDDEGQDLPNGEVGFLWVRGNSLAHGYWQRPEQTRRAFRGEWYVSEDMLSRDADGYFTYRGRADDMLKVSGKWLSPQEVENCLVQHPAVREACVVGVTGEDGLARPHAFVVVSAAGSGSSPPGPEGPPAEQERRTTASEEPAGSQRPAAGWEPSSVRSEEPDRGARYRSAASDALAAELKAFAHERLERYKVPARIIFMDELPRTHLGKVDRGRLRAAWPANESLQIRG